MKFADGFAVYRLSLVLAFGDRVAATNVTTISASNVQIVSGVTSSVLRRGDRTSVREHNILLGTGSVMLGIFTS